MNVRILTCLLVVTACSGEPPLTSSESDSTESDGPSADDAAQSDSSDEESDGAPSSEESNTEATDEPNVAGEEGPPRASGTLNCSDAEQYGARATTQTYDGQTHLVSDLDADCRASGERVMLFVQEGLYERPVTQPQLDAFVERLEATDGILATLENAFAPIQYDLFPGGKIPIFVIDTGQAGEGYVCGWCEQRELHLDGTLLKPLDGDRAFGIAAHELFHLVHRMYDEDELVWVDETLAQAAMVAAGFPEDEEWLQAYLRNPNVDWGPGSDELNRFQYGAGLVFGAYLWEQGGAPLTRAATLQQQDGWRGLDLALETTGFSTTALGMFRQMAAALYLDDPDRGYGFDVLDVELPAAIGLSSGESRRGVLQPYGLFYIELEDGVSELHVDAPADVLVSGLTEDATLIEVELGTDRQREDIQVLILTATQQSDFEVSVW